MKPVVSWLAFVYLVECSPKVVGVVVVVEIITELELVLTGLGTGFTVLISLGVPPRDGKQDRTKWQWNDIIIQRTMKTVRFFMAELKSAYCRRALKNICSRAVKPQHQPAFSKEITTLSGSVEEVADQHQPILSHLAISRQTSEKWRPSPKQRSSALLVHTDNLCSSSSWKHDLSSGWWHLHWLDHVI